MDQARTSYAQMTCPPWIRHGQLGPGHLAARPSGPGGLAIFSSDRNSHPDRGPKAPVGLAPGAVDAPGEGHGRAATPTGPKSRTSVSRPDAPVQTRILW